MDTGTGLRLVTFTSSKAELEGFKELMFVGQSVRIQKDGKYLISGRECSHLKDKGIGYKIIKKL